MFQRAWNSTTNQCIVSAPGYMKGLDTGHCANTLMVQHCSGFMAAQMLDLTSQQWAAAKQHCSSVKPARFPSMGKILLGTNLLDRNQLGRDVRCGWNFRSLIQFWSNPYGLMIMVPSAHGIRLCWSGFQRFPINSQLLGLKSKSLCRH